MKNRGSHPFGKVVTALLVPALIAASVPVVQAEARPSREESDSAGPPPALPSFSSPPTDAEISHARFFEEPLWPIGGNTTPAENSALAAALLAYLRGNDYQNLSAFEPFLAGYPDSAWGASLLTNLGLVYRRSGYFSRALVAWERAWSRGQGATEPRAVALADRALGELALLNARLGRRERLETLLAETAGRDVRGSATEKVGEAKSELWQMRNQPERAARCGPLALDRILRHNNPNYRGSPLILDFPARPRGISLAQLRGLAGDLGLPMQMAKRTGNGAVPLPAVVHWRTGHFAALLRRTGDRYTLHDSVLGQASALSPRALDDEASGYYLVPEGPLPSGWRVVGETEGGEVWGKGYPPGGGNLQHQTSCDHKVTGSSCSSCPPMAIHAVHTMLVNLNITDSPLRYSPALGPAVEFRLTYNQRETFQPQVFIYSNLGPKWTFDWLSYIEADTDPDSPASLYLRGGGQETYTFPPGSPMSSPHLISRATVQRVSSTHYIRYPPDGSREVFSQPEGQPGFPLKIFLTQWVDAQGNALTFNYTGHPLIGLRLTSVTDSLGRTTQLFYNHADPLKITSVRDPFQREAFFQYNASGRLSKITDMIGITSEFTYGASDFITGLTTPYGTTNFTMGADSATNRWIEIQDPLGGRERVEYQADNTVTSFPTGEPVPSGFQTPYPNLGYRNSFYWDKIAMARTPRDYSTARIYHWLHDEERTFSSGTLESEKMPLENRVWYQYPGQLGNPYYMGTGTKPIRIGRVLGGGGTQTHLYDYNDKGHVITQKDPAGRRTSYCYAADNIDLLQVRQTTGWPEPPNAVPDPCTGTVPAGAINVILGSHTYNAQHEVLTSTDTSGQTTTYTYKTDGRLETVVTPPRVGWQPTESTSRALTPLERTTAYTYYPDNDPDLARRKRLQSVTGPSSPQGSPVTSYTYDSKGRVRTVTTADTPENYTLNYDYDDLDRQTRVTYPDNTNEETAYDRLDAVRHRDRLRRWTHSFYDALRRRIATRDPEGRTVRQKYCACGSLDEVIDGKGNVTRWAYDLQGRVEQEYHADSLPWVHDYEDATGRLKSVTDPKGQTKNYSYYPDDNLQAVTYSGPGVTTPPVSYTYDLVYNRPATMTDGTGTTTYLYHPYTSGLGRGALMTVVGPLEGTADDLSYTYDEMGRIKTRGLPVPPAFVNTFDFDSLGRLTRETNSPLGPFKYAYDGHTGRVTKLEYPNGQYTSYAFHPNAEDRRLQEIHHRKLDGTTLSRFTYGSYDDVGNIKTWQQQYTSNPAQAEAYELGYDFADQLRSATLKNTATLPLILKRYGYAYDAAGNRTAEQIDLASMEEVPDARNQLVTRRPGGTLLFRGSVNEPATMTVQGQPATVTDTNLFEGAGQPSPGTNQVIVTATDPGNRTRANTYSLPTDTTSPTSYVYDANGNLCSEGGTTCFNGTRKYEWDAENRLVAVKQGAATIASFTYDGQGRRATKTAGGVTRTYLYDQEDIIEERLNPGGSFRYVHGPGADQPFASRDQGGAVTYFLADHLGSIVQTADSAGNPLAARQYDPWGKLLPGSSTASGYAFTGREWDPETGLYYYRARYYDPVNGRFVSEDPIGFAGGLNFYSYTANHPIGRTDPFGLQTNPPPPNINGGEPWQWQGDPQNSRCGCFVDEFGNRASWDPKYRHWDVDPAGGGRRVRFGAWGNLLSGSAQHKAQGGPRNPLPPSRFRGRGFGGMGGGLGMCLGVLSIISIILQAHEYGEARKEEEEFCKENPCDPFCLSLGKCIA